MISYFVVCFVFVFFSLFWLVKYNWRNLAPREFQKMYQKSTRSQSLFLKNTNLKRFDLKFNKIEIKNKVGPRTYYLHTKIISNENYQWSYTTLTSTMYRKLSGWLKCSLIHWAGVSRGGSMPWITTRHSLSIAPLPLVNASGTNSCNKSPRVRSSPARKKQERVVAWNGNRSFCPRVSRFARGLLRNIVEPLFRGRPSGPWQVSPKINGGLAGIC